MIFSFKQCSFVRDFTCWRDLVIRVPLSHNFWGELSRPRPIWNSFSFLDLSQLSHTSRGVSHWDFLSSENFSRFESFESHVTRWDFLSSDNFSLRLFYVPFLVLDYDLFWTYLRCSDCFSKAYKPPATIIQDLFTSILLSKSPFSLETTLGNHLLSWILSASEVARRPWRIPTIHWPGFQFCDAISEQSHPSFVSLRGLRQLFLS